jgi:arylsulfatase A-like enzyme
MTFRLHSLLPALLLACCVHAADRPNVLFIASDDLRPELGCYGNTIIKSPNIDRLAGWGMRFDRAYCQQAVCSPSRTSLLTGARPDSTKVYDLQTHFRSTMGFDIVTLPQQFKQQGYHTESMGKLYHGGLDDELSWSVPAWKPPAGKQGKKTSAAKADEDDCVDAKSIQELENKAKETQKKRRTTPRGPAYASPDVADNALFDGAMTDHAVQRLQALKSSDKPFFMAVGYLKPHLPFIAPKKYADLYDPAAIPPAENPFAPKDAPKHALSGFGELRAYEGMPKQGGVTAQQARELKHTYYAAVSYIDAQIGRLLDTLESTGLKKNTIVIFWGDHGWKLGEHGEWCKHTNFEDDTNVVLLLAAPGKKPGQSTRALVEFVDIYPTLCELAGLPLPGHLEGRSMVPLLDDPSRPWKSAAFSQYPRNNLMGYSMRTERYRYTRWVDRKDPARVDSVELYDHQSDPRENVNLAGNPAHAALLKQLEAQAAGGWRGALPN